MLQVQTIPATLVVLLAQFRPCFTKPTYARFVVLLCGLVVMPVHRTVCGMLVGTGLAGVTHHGWAHWFFARARWNVDELSSVLAGLVIDILVPADQDVTIAVDDTLFKRSGRKVHGAGWFHDGAAKGPNENRIAWGEKCATGRTTTFPIKSGGTRREVSGSAGLPEFERAKGTVACQTA